MNDTVSSNGISSNIYSLFCRDSFFFFLQLCSTCDIKRIITGHAFLPEPPPTLLYTSVFLSKPFRITAYIHPFFSFCDFFFFSFFHCSIFEIDEIEIVIVTLLLISNKQLSIINQISSDELLNCERVKKTLRVKKKEEDPKIFKYFSRRIS